MKYLILALMVSMVIGCVKKDDISDDYTFIDLSAEMTRANLDYLKQEQERIAANHILYIWSPEEEAYDDYFKIEPHGKWKMENSQPDENMDKIVSIMSHPDGDKWRITIERMDDNKEEN